MLAWARALDPERVWAIEDCRHVSGKLERFLLARGERVVRVPPKLMAGRRRGSRQPGKSDPIDALAVARAALEEGIETLPVAQLEGRARAKSSCCSITAKTSSASARGSRTACVGCSTIAGTSSRCPRAASTGASGSIASRAASGALPRTPTSESCAQVRRLKELAREASTVEGELLMLVRDLQPRLLALPGVGALTAAKLIAEVAGIERFRSQAKLARLAGVAPIRHRAATAPASASTAAAIANSMLPSTASPSRSFAFIRQPRTTWLVALVRASPSARHFAASSVTWSGRSSTRCSIRPRLHSTRRSP